MYACILYDSSTLDQQQERTAVVKEDFFKTSAIMKIFLKEGPDAT